MDLNFAIVIGLDGAGEPQGLYVGRDFEKAYQLLDSEPEGIEWVFVYRNLVPIRRRQTEASVLLERKRHEDAERRGNEMREKLEATARADREAKAAEEKARLAKIQAEAAAQQESRHAKKLAEEAEILERLAKAAREKCNQAAAGVTATGERDQTNTALAGSNTDGSPSGTSDSSTPGAVVGSPGEDETEQSLGTLLETVPAPPADAEQLTEAEATELAPGEGIEPEAVIAAPEPEKARRNRRR